MSPLWRDEIAIYLAPRKLALVRCTRGPKRRVVAATEVAVPEGSVGDIDAVLGRLGAVLNEATWHDGVARAIVADRWARYGIVPWPETLLDAAGRLTHARYVLSDTYGESVSDWALTLADTPPGRAYVACAMPATLRGALEDTIAPARLKLVSLQPQLIVAFNAWRDRLPPDDTWFVSVDDGSLSAVHLTDGAWDRVHTARLSPDWKVELERLQAFGRLTRAAGALGNGRMFVDAPLWMRRGAPESAEIEWLEDVGGDGNQAHELALLQRGFA